MVGLNDLFRRTFPKNHQLVMFTFGSWFGAYGVYKMIKGPARAPVASTHVEKHEAPAAQEGSKNPNPVPTLDTLDQWTQNEANVKAWEQWLEKPGAVDEWAKQYS